jgi:hypothetical protein
MHLLDQGVDDPDLVSVFKQFVDDVAADEAAAAGDENAH